MNDTFVDLADYFVQPDDAKVAPSPGPWYEETDDNGDHWVMMDGGHHKVLIGNLEGTCPVCHANAQLIIAAPDLLAACEAALIQMVGLGNQVNWDDVPEGYADAINGIRAAIAKAKGEAE